MPDFFNSLLIYKHRVFYFLKLYEKTDNLHHHITIGDFCLIFLVLVMKLMNLFISRIFTICLKFLTTLQECFSSIICLWINLGFLIKGLICKCVRRKYCILCFLWKIPHISAFFSTNGSVANLLCTVWMDWLFLRSPWVFCGEVSTNSCLLLRLLFHLFVFSSIIVQILQFSSSCEKSSDSYFYGIPVWLSHISSFSKSMCTTSFMWVNWSVIIDRWTSSSVLGMAEESFFCDPCLQNKVLITYCIL